MPSSTDRSAQANAILPRTLSQAEPTVKLDAIDQKILDLLQEDADQQGAEIAAKVGLSTTPCWRRVQRLKESGVIKKSVALVDAQKVNVGVTVFVSVRTSTHTQEWFENFKACIQVMPEVVEFYRMSGEIDYLLRVVVPDIAAYDRVYKKLIANNHLCDISSSFAMEEIKFTTALPLNYAR